MKETTPQREAGMRKLPAKSEPMPNAEPPDAYRAASPPEEPPGVLKYFKWVNKNKNENVDVMKR